ncbi:hypothetical protein V1290_000221 [Bradyrhizobium sp. AZCC 1578]
MEIGLWIVLTLAAVYLLARWLLARLFPKDTP